MKTLMRHLWLGAAALGLLFVVLGVWFVIMALDAKDMIRTALAEENVTTGADAVNYGSLLARKGETVMLSPACASFDMFENFEARGDVFKQIVSDL